MGKSVKQKKEDYRSAEREKWMDDSLLDDRSASWGVASSGYSWVGDGESRMLAYAIIPTPLKQFDEYNPLDRRGLFFEFAKAEPTEEGFAAFANRNGLLGVEREVETGSPFIKGELWADWKEAHSRVRNSVHLWERIQAGDVSDCVSLAKEPTVQSKWRAAPQKSRSDANPLPYRWQFHSPHSKSVRPPVFALAEAEPVSAARRMLQAEINCGLTGKTRACVLWNEESKEYVFRVLPVTLIGCMWWALGRTFSGELQFRRCPVCDRHIEIGKEKHSQSVRFCSAACKQRDYRERKALAAEAATKAKRGERSGT